MIMAYSIWLFLIYFVLPINFSRFSLIEEYDHAHSVKFGMFLSVSHSFTFVYTLALLLNQ